MCVRLKILTIIDFERKIQTKAEDTLEGWRGVRLIDREDVSPTSLSH